jgi:hypothetical protein
MRNLFLHLFVILVISGGSPPSRAVSGQALPIDCSFLNSLGHDSDSPDSLTAKFSSIVSYLVSKNAFSQEALDALEKTVEPVNPVKAVDTLLETKERHAAEKAFELLLITQSGKEKLDWKTVLKELRRVRAAQGEGKIIRESAKQETRPLYLAVHLENLAGPAWSDLKFGPTTKGDPRIIYENSTLVAARTMNLKTGDSKVFAGDYARFMSAFEKSSGELLAVVAQGSRISSEKLIVTNADTAEILAEVPFVGNHGNLFFTELSEGRDGRIRLYVGTASEYDLEWLDFKYSIYDIATRRWHRGRKERYDSARRFSLSTGPILEMTLKDKDTVRVTDLLRISNPAIEVTAPGKFIGNQELFEGHDKSPYLAFLNRANSNGTVSFQIRNLKTQVTKEWVLANLPGFNRIKISRHWRQQDGSTGFLIEDSTSWPHTYYLVNTREAEAKQLPHDERLGFVWTTHLQLRDGRLLLIGSANGADPQPGEFFVVYDVTNEQFLLDAGGGQAKLASREMWVKELEDGRIEVLNEGFQGRTGIQRVQIYGPVPR